MSNTQVQRENFLHENEHSLEAISVNRSPASGSTPSRLKSSNIAAWYAFTSMRNGRVFGRLNLIIRVHMDTPRK